MIILEIENSFSNPFNPEIYEKSVIIERRIFHNGISFYFIRNETGTIISLEESVLKSILQHFSIFGLIVLPGSKSKSFFNDSTDGKRFSFLEGVQILPVIQNYEETFGLIRELTRKVFWKIRSWIYQRLHFNKNKNRSSCGWAKSEDYYLYGIIGKGIELAKTKAEVSGDCFLSFSYTFD